MWKNKFCIKPQMSVKCLCKMVCYEQKELLTSVSFGLKTNGLTACAPNAVSDILCNKVVPSLSAKVSDICINSNFINLNKEKDITVLLFCSFDPLVIPGCCAETPQQGAQASKRKAERFLCYRIIAVVLPNFLFNLKSTFAPVSDKK